MIRVLVLGGIFLQMIISGQSRKMGAIVGFIVTTIILFWGLNAYNTGYVMMLANIELSFSAFIIACLIWYGLDAWEYMQGNKGQKATVFLTAASKGQLDVIDKMIAEGIDINTKSVSDDTALSLAVLGGHQDAIDWLIKHGADINNKNANGMTPLLLASQNGHKEIAELLIASGADVNAVNKAGETALKVSQQNGRQEIADILGGAGKGVNA